jgi:hypothetical protein
MSTHTLFSQPQNDTSGTIIQNYAPILYVDPNDKVNLYKRSDHVKRQQLLGQLNAVEMKELYEFYLDEFKDLITSLKTQNNIAHVQARAMYDNIISVKEQKFSGRSDFHISHKLLFESLHKSADLIRSVNSDNTLSSEFEARSQEYNATILAIKKSAGENKFYGVMNALLAAIGIAGMIAASAVSILTLGATIPHLLFWGGGILASGVVASPSIFLAHSHFKKASEKIVLTNQMEALNTAILSSAPRIH